MRPRDQNKMALAEAVGAFYLHTHSGDSEAAKDEICRIGFIHLERYGDLVVMEVRRPGILIGRRGERVQQIRDFLQKRIGEPAAPSLKIHIVEAPSVLEDHILRGATPADPEFDLPADSDDVDRIIDSRIDRLASALLEHGRGADFDDDVSICRRLKEAVGEDVELSEVGMVRERYEALRDAPERPATPVRYPVPHPGQYPALDDAEDPDLPQD